MSKIKRRSGPRAVVSANVSETVGTVLDLLDDSIDFHESQGPSGFGHDVTSPSVIRRLRRQVRDIRLTIRSSRGRVSRSLVAKLINGDFAT